MLILTKCTAVPHESYYRALQVLLASESKIAIPQYSYLFTHVHPLRYVGAFIHFGATGGDESAPTPTECMLRIIHVHQRLHPHAPTVGIRFIVPAYHGIHAVDIYSFSSILLRRKKLCNDGCNIHSA